MEKMAMVIRNRELDAMSMTMQLSHHASTDDDRVALSASYHALGETKCLTDLGVQPSTDIRNFEQADQSTKSFSRIGCQHHACLHGLLA